MAEWKTETVPLLHPIKVGERSVSELTLHEPNAGALEEMEEAGLFKGPAAAEEGADPDNVQLSIRQMRAMIQALTRETPQVIKSLHAADFTRLGEKAVPLLSTFAGSASAAK